MVGRQGCVVALAFALWGLVPCPLSAVAAPPGAVERFRAAAALQERELFDLAAADFASLERDCAGDPLATRAGLARGVCLFQLGRFDEVAVALAPLRDRQADLIAAEREQLLAYSGLTHYNLGQSAQGAGSAQHISDEHFDAAIEVLARQLREFPNGRFAPQAAFYSAEAFYARRRLDEAANAYRALLTKFPQHPQRPEAVLGLAAAEHEQQQYAAATEAYAQFEREYPQHASLADVRMQHADALLSLADERRAASDFAAARSAAESVLSQFPESADVPPAYLVLAQVQLAERDLASSENSLDQCLRRSTTPEVTRDAYLLRARVRCERGNAAGSLADASAVLVRDPLRVEALHLRGLAETALGRPHDATQTLSQVLAAEPHYAAADRVLYELAWAYELDDNASQAAATYSQLLQRDPRGPLAAECLFRIGQINFDAREFAAAAERFRAAIAAASDASLREKAIHQLAWCQFNSRDFAAARETFEKQIAEYPATPLTADAQAMAGECCFESRQFGPALAFYATAIEHLTVESLLRPLALVHASQAAAEMQHWQRSLELAEQALREYPSDEHAADAHYLQGAALLELGQLEEAHRELTAVAAKSDGLRKTKAELALGRVHETRHESEDAVRWYFKVAYGQGGKSAPDSYHPWQAEAVFAAARTLAESGRKDAARKLYEELLANYPASAPAALAQKSLDETVRR